jgi:hypothetical protein
VGCSCGNLSFPNGNPTRVCGNTVPNRPSAGPTCQVSTGWGCHVIHATSPPRSETLPLFLAGCAGSLPPYRYEPPGYHRNNPPGTSPLQEQPARQAQGGAATWQPASKRNAPAVPRGVCRLSAAIPLRTARLPQEQPHQVSPSCRTPRSETLPLFLAGCAGHLPPYRYEPPGYHRNNPPGAGTTCQASTGRGCHLAARRAPGMACSELVSLENRKAKADREVTNR